MERHRRKRSNKLLLKAIIIFLILCWAMTILVMYPHSSNLVRVIDPYEDAAKKMAQKIVAEEVAREVAKVRAEYEERLKPKIILETPAQKEAHSVALMVLKQHKERLAKKKAEQEKRDAEKAKQEKQTAAKISQLPIRGDVGSESVSDDNVSSNVKIESADSVDAVTIISSSEETENKEINSNQIIEPVVAEIIKSPFEQAKEMAERDNSRAQFNLAGMYLSGNGTEKNIPEAVKWYKAAADNGDAKAEVALGYIYLQGLLGSKDDKEALKWFERASFHKEVDGQFQSGLSYMFGRGTKRSFTKAAFYFEQSALRGHADSQYNLGVMYYEGTGVKRSFSTSIKWLRKAQRSGHKKAPTLLKQLMTQKR